MTNDSVERKKAEVERDLLFALSLDLLCIADLRGFRRVNPAFCKALGYTEQELTSRPFLDFVHPDDIASTQGAVARLREGGDVIRFENRYRCKDGSYRWLSWQCPAPLAGSETLYAVARDVTEERRVKAELENAINEADAANRAKSEFLSRMSHELRTPLNAILGFGQLLQREPLSARQRQHVDLMVQGGRHLLTLINEVLDISRLEVSPLDLSLEPVDLAEIIHEVINLTRPMADQRGVAVTLDEDSARGHAALAHKRRLRQVLLNLVSNAIKYNRDQGAVTLRCVPREDGRLQIHVQDTGPGIEPGMQPRLFTPFDRLGAENTPIEGSGLGLVLSKRLVEIMGGTLTYVSERGRGTTFIVEIARGAPASATSEDDKAPVAAPPIGPLRTVLCIEDNRTNVQLIQAMLAHRPGIRLIASLRGGDAIAAARRQRPDLILLDVHLPDVAGAELMAGLKADVDLADVPVIVVSADATTAQIERLLAAGASEYLTKPLDIDHFLGVLDRFLRPRV